MVQCGTFSQTKPTPDDEFLVLPQPQQATYWIYGVSNKQPAVYVC
jgi:hypothetical protein